MQNDVLLETSFLVVYRTSALSPSKALVYSTWLAANNLIPERILDLRRIFWGLARVLVSSNSRTHRPGVDRSADKLFTANQVLYTNAFEGLTQTFVYLQERTFRAGRHFA